MKPFSAEMRAGAVAVAPMLIGIIPFGLIAGATPVTDGLGGAAAVGLSTIVFAGASQLAAADVLAHGGSVVVAVLAACTINLRMLLYSASIAPYLADEPLPRRLAAAYLLTDQAYAVSITRWASDTASSDTASSDTASSDTASSDIASSDTGGGRRFAYFLGAGLLLWAVWQASTIVGVLVGAAVPADVPLDFAVPLVFLVLLVPTLTSRPALVAAAVGGAAAVSAAEAGAGPLYVIVGALSGIAAGGGRRGARRPGTSLSRVWAVIVLSGAGTFAMRASFLAAANRVTNVPPRIRRLLRQIPPAALASLVVPALVRPHGSLDLVQGRLAAGVLAALVAWRTRSVALTLVIGLGALIVIQAL